MIEGDQLASPTTVVRKLWSRLLLGVVLLAPATYLFGGRTGVSAEHVAIWLALVAALAAYCVVTSSFADCVADYGDYLLVRRRKLELQLKFADIAYVEDSHNLKPRRVTLHLKSSGPLGQRIVFMPRPNSLGRNEVAFDLERRVNLSRNET
ncbi:MULTISPECIES: hypothetical protein [Lysobacter]|uniref:hypothetical protein n=1 Tax=Lysobacter TaxID=68 RepID=UPI0004D0239F|nr:MULTISPECIES: hypothetical protein [Lysobacter]